MVTKTATMKAMVITGNGDTDVFQEKEVLMPRPQGRELLVKVHATLVICSKRQVEIGSNQNLN